MASLRLSFLIVVIACFLTTFSLFSQAAVAQSDQAAGVLPNQATGASQSDSKRLLVIGEEFAPYEFVQDGKVVGIDIDICNHIFAKLGYDVEAQSLLGEVDNASENDTKLFSAASYQLISEGKLAEGNRRTRC